MGTEKVIQLLQDQLEHLNAEYGVSRIGLFGSVASGKANELSNALLDAKRLV